MSTPELEAVALEPRPGQQLGDPWTFPVERGKLRELALALGGPAEVWSDPDVAAGEGFDGVPLLPTATVIGDLWREGGFFVANVKTTVAPYPTGTE